MKRIVLIIVFGILLSLPVFGQAIDIPSWVKEGMTLIQIQSSLGGVSLIKSQGSDWYSYNVNGVYQEFLIHPEKGLCSYVIARHRIDMNSLISDLTRKYNLQQPKFEDGTYIWSHRTAGNLFREKLIVGIEIWQEAHSFVHFQVWFGLYDFIYIWNKQ